MFLALEKLSGKSPINSEAREIIGYYGDYWHGNPKKFDPGSINTKMNKTYGEIYQSTINREYLFRSLGYTVISVWQSDFSI